MSLILLTYACLIIGAVAAGVRIYRQVKLPLHLRWELYPVKHEAGNKAQYGGSYMEEPNWWEKERRRSLVNELRYMVPEILLLRGLYQGNRGLWNVSYPFHLSLYLLLGTLFLLVLGAILMLFRISIIPGKGFMPAFIYYLTILTGFGGLTGGTLGVVGLLHQRIKNPKLKAYSTLADYLNLLFFLFVLGASLLAWLFHDHAFDGARTYLYGLLTLGGQPGETTEASFLGRLATVLISLIIAYVPLTHMSHFFMKYFIYHWVRWEDNPNVKGSDIEAAVMRNLGFKPTWAASHTGADGGKTWAEIASSRPGGDR